MADAGLELKGSLQENILTLLCWDRTHASTIRGFIPLTLYSNQIYRRIAEVSYQFLDQFNRPPETHLPDLLETEFGTEEGELYKDKIRSMRILYKSGINKEFVVSKLNDFIGEYSLRTSIIAASRALTGGEPWTVARGIIDASQKVRGDLVSSNSMQKLIQDVIVNQNRVARDFITLNIPELDQHELGPARKELFTVVGGSKSGKTSMLLHIAKQAALQRWKVLYVTLEVSEEELAIRMAQAIFGLKRRETDKVMRTFVHFNAAGGVKNLETVEVEKDYVYSSEARQRIRGQLEKTRLLKRIHVKSFPTGSLTVAELKSFLDLMENSNNFVPDLLIVDYPDLMKLPATGERRLQLGDLYKDIRGLAVERNMAAAVASQTNRRGAGVSLATALDIGEDYSKIATSDIVLTINVTGKERSASLARIYVAASRISEAHFSVLLTQSPATAQFVIKSYKANSEWLKFARSKEDDGEEGEEQTESLMKSTRKPKNLNGAHHDA